MKPVTKRRRREAFPVQGMFGKLKPFSLTGLREKPRDIASRFEEIARKAKLREKDLVYGDELYEEVLGR